MTKRETMFPKPPSSGLPEATRSAGGESLHPESCKIQVIDAVDNPYNATAQDHFIYLHL